MHLARFDIARFLATAWQKQPLLIRNPWAQWDNPLEPDELAGLACEAGVESRLIVRGPDGLTLEHGPLAEDRFAGLGADPWTLLVQAVDQHAPQVAALIEPFRFVPDWRIDDVMISYATDGAGVGPHYDQYDVFLIQGLGRRRWRVGPRCDAATPRQPHADLALIADFAATDEWVLEPGDILYVPPGFAHDGVALGDDCMTYSIGFRAPRAPNWSKAGARMWPMRWRTRSMRRPIAMPIPTSPCRTIPAKSRPRRSTGCTPWRWRRWPIALPLPAGSAR
jgi:50S ribosomal protein L16 3-hydroxylase